MVYVIDDDLHYDLHIRFARFDEAVAEIQRRVALPWDDEDNQAPCINWETCERQYWIYECDDSSGSGEEVRKLHVVKICAEGVFWNDGFEDGSGWQEPSW